MQLKRHDFKGSFSLEILSKGCFFVRAYHHNIQFVLNYLKLDNLSNCAPQIRTAVVSAALQL